MLRRELTGARISDIFKIELDEIISRHSTGREKIDNKNVKMRDIKRKKWKGLHSWIATDVFFLSYNDCIILL